MNTIKMGIVYNDQPGEEYLLHDYIHARVVKCLRDGFDWPAASSRHIAYFSGGPYWLILE